jgi:hypothetical protein
MGQEFQVSAYGKLNCKHAGPDGGKKSSLKRADAKSLAFFPATTRGLCRRAIRAIDIAVE